MWKVLNISDKNYKGEKMSKIKVGIVGYEIPFNRHFYEYVPPRSLEVIDAELETLNKEIMEMLHEI